MASGKRERRYLDLLLHVGELLGESIDYQTTIQNVCDAIVEEFADVCLLDLGTTETLSLAAAAHADTSKTQMLKGAGNFLISDGGATEHPATHVMTIGMPLLVPHVSDTYINESATSARHAEFMRQLEYRSLMIVPLYSTTQGILGTLTLVRTDDLAPFDPQDLAFAQELSRRCAAAIGKAILFEQTQRISTLFQRAALPHALPTVPGITFDAYYEPSSENLLVGGDWYDACILPDRRVAITVGDVLGHGIEAAVWMSRLRNSLRAALYTDPDPARALIVVDHLMRLESDEAFTTALVAIIDPVHQTLSVASAGHPGPMVFEPDGGVTDRFLSQSLPLGLQDLETSTQSTQTITLRPGMFAVFFTDGLLEWNRDISGAWQIMTEAVLRRDVREAEHPALTLRNAVLGSSPHQDDIAILAIRIDELVRREVGR